MTLTRRHLALLIALVALLAVSIVWASRKNSDQLEVRKRAAHAINRLTFGPKPGDVDRVMAIGVDQWIDQQLHPEKIDDSAISARLSGLRTLHMSTQEIVNNFPPPQFIKAVANGRMSLPKDAAKRAIYESQIQRLKQKQGATAATADGGAGDDDTHPPERRARRQAAREKFDEVMAMSPDERMKAIFEMPPADRAAFARGLSSRDRMELYESVSPEQREQLMALRNPELVVVTELQQAKLLRAAYSERQLEEVMTDFWFNHFNVFINKGPDRYLTTAYERDVIRPHVFGKFKDLLIATAKSPAMLWYLDNWQSVGPDSDLARHGPNDWSALHALRLISRGGNHPRLIHRELRIRRLPRS